MKLLIILLPLSIKVFHISACTLGTATGCSTDVASGLTTQLIDELNSMGISFVSLDDRDRFRCSSPCVPYLQQSAKDALEAATLEKNDFITLNSAYRSSAQQYLLYQWFLDDQCNIPAAARPGRSRHEDGLAIDVRSYSFWRSTLEQFSWDWFGSRDRVHFTFVGSDSSSGVRRKSLEAFQRLWNRNNPADQIDEDGIYGPNTAARLSRAPCDGW